MMLLFLFQIDLQTERHTYIRSATEVEKNNNTILDSHGAFIYHCQGLNVVKPVYNGSLTCGTLYFKVSKWNERASETEKGEEISNTFALTSHNHSTRYKSHEGIQYEW